MSNNVVGFSYTNQQDIKEINENTLGGNSLKLPKAQEKCFNFFTLKDY